MSKNKPGICCVCVWMNESLTMKAHNSVNSEYVLENLKIFARGWWCELYCDCRWKINRILYVYTCVYEDGVKYTCKITK